MIARTPEIDELLAKPTTILAYSVSGGKDGDALVLACESELRGVSRPRLLIHADLGQVEWQQSLPQCQRLADRVGLDLLVVRRKKGGMLERWQQRWRDNMARYANLETVSLILPWSTPSMRFCTSELKTAIICRELRQRYPGQLILNAVGLRAEESTERAKKPICKSQRLLSDAAGTSGYTWLPILHWSLDDVWAIHQAQHFALHHAYTTYGMSRVSCVFCIMATKCDLTNAASVPAHADVYRAMVDLEIASTFAFQGRQWLGDIAPQLLTEQQQQAFAMAKCRAHQREQAEQRIPKHLRFDRKGWPTVMPSCSEAHLLAEVRQEVASAVGIAIDFQTADSILQRYADLMARRELVS